MDDPSANIFVALFEFHPRDGLTPKENFLTEAFAHVLKVCDEARDSWASLALDQKVSLSSCRIATRQSERDGTDTVIFPDMTTDVRLSDDQRIELLGEHKWDSPCNPKQLQRYLKLTERADRRAHCRVVFIGATRRQKSEAERCDSRIRAFMWADVFRALEGVRTKPDVLVQFLEFMKAHALNPGMPINQAAMLAFMQSSKFEDSLEHMAHRLLECDWSVLPERFRSDPQVAKGWGRIAVVFSTPNWRPTITAGFLFDTDDHRVSFVNPKKGIDLLLRLEASPSTLAHVRPVLSELDHKRAALSKCAGSILLLNEPGNGNRHSILIVRSCLGDVIEGAASQDAQLEAIFETLKRWIHVLFDDGRLERALKEAGLDSGLNSGEGEA